MTILVGAASDPGRVRANNEDRYAVLESEVLPTGLDAALIVADGMGGHQAGEVASGMIVDWFVRQLARPQTAPGAGARPSPDWLAVLDRLVAESNALVHDAAAEDDLHFGMGSTVIAALIADGRLYVSNVGDSRAYLINGPDVYQLSHDHSWVAEEVRAGRLTQGDARHHPRKNVLTRAVGVSPAVEASTGQFELGPGDWVLLCTDGLTNLVSDAELAQVLRANPEPATAARKLVDLANARGAPDNVTVAIAKVTS